MIDRMNFGSSKYQGPAVYIFVPEYEFDGTIKTVKDFVKKVHVRCYGVLVTGPYLFKCREKKQDYHTYHNRQDSEIFSTFEECLEHYQDGFDSKWIKMVRGNLNKWIGYTENTIKSHKENLKVQKSQLTEFEKLCSSLE